MENQNEKMMEAVKEHAGRTRKLISEVRTHSDRTYKLLTEFRVHLAGGEVPEGGVLSMHPCDEKLWEDARDAFCNGLMYLTRAVEKLEN